MDSNALIQALQNPSLYDHPITRFEVIETHLSWIILTGPFAYKIKKPVYFPFVDFSTLKKRLFYCQEELRLNQRLAPALYLGLTPLSGSLHHPHFGTHPYPIEYAVKMIQFDRNLVLTQLLQKGGVTIDQLNDLAEQISTFHQTIPRSDPLSPYGGLQSIQYSMSDNFKECNALNPSPALKPILSQLEDWSKETFKTLQDLFLTRKKEGFVRECHGDLHLENIVLFNDRMLIFDCMEFNIDFRWIDTINEIAFLTMDLHARNHPEKAFYFLNRYLELTGDFEGLLLLSFYQVYRAMIRAKVALLTPNTNALSLFTRYLELCQTLIQKPKPRLILVQGVSGSGKTSLAQDLAPLLQAILLRSDIERKRLFLTDVKDKKKIELYSSEKTEMTYQKLKALTRLLLDAGYNVIVDATFLKRIHRQAFKELAQNLQIPFLILACQASNEQLRKRIVYRQHKKQDASDADLKVLNWQLQNQEAFSEDELKGVRFIKTDQPIDITILARSDIFRQ